VAIALPDLVGGGAERVCVDLAEGLLARFVEVDIVVVRDQGQLRAVVPSGARTVALGRSGVSLCVPSLARYLRWRRPDVVISALSHMNLAAILACRLVRPRVPVVVTQHNHLSTSSAHAEMRRDRVMPRLIRLAYPFADGIVAVSGGVADDLAATTGLARDVIEVVYNPVAFERIMSAGAVTPDHPWLSPKTTPVVVAMGRLVEQKDFATLIRAMARLPEPVRLIILGEGPRRRSLEDLAAQLGVAERVALPGFVDNPYPYLAQADVFASSSRWEGLPTVLIEALAFDTPIVATDCESGPREILDHGEWGRLVPVGDPVRLADAISESLSAARLDRPRARLPYRIDAVTSHYLSLLPGGEPAGHNAP
jgi:glycosyltransferase involved in cell wall biosynthesis